MKYVLPVLTLAALLAAAPQARSAVIIHESFSYTPASTNPDPDGGLNGGMGLPATNVGGNPSGTGTGLRGQWASVTVVDGLNYTQGGNALQTVGGAGLVTNATWGTDLNWYRLTTDPFVGYRNNSTTGNWGTDGTMLYFSTLMKLTDSWVPGNVARFKIGAAETSGNTYFGVNLGGAANKWGISRGSTGTFGDSGVAASAGQTVLLVAKFVFGNGNVDTIDLWVNPVLGQDPGAPMASISGGDFTMTNFNTRPGTASAMILDEIRLGESYADVTPFSAVPEPSTVAALLGLGAFALGVRRGRR